MLNNSEPKIITQFRGQSGCRVELIRRDGQLRVRKVATTKVTIERLKLQFKRMDLFQSLQVVKVPAIYESTDHREFYTYEMEYCNLSTTLADAVEGLHLYELRDIVDFLKALLEEFEKIPFQGKPQKFEEANTHKLHSLMHNEDIQRYPGVIQCLKKIYSDRKNYFEPIAHLERRISHGDLTMENILCDSRGEKWLIDPIDIFFEHPWCDISKLYQDIEGEWYQIRNHVQHRRASSNLWRLGHVLKSWICEKYPQYLEYHYYFLGLNFARILPYAQRDSLRSVVSQKTENYLKLFLNGQSL